MLRRWCAAGGLLLAACVTPTPASPDPTAESVQVVSGTAEAAVTDTPRPPQKILRLWVQPEFDPKANTHAGAELLDQLRQFESANHSIKVEVRVKQAAGSGGMIDSLRASIDAAPGALPDVVAIDARNLESATANDLIVALDGFVSPDIIEDYYPFALESVRSNGRIMALPFASDALVSAYATTAYEQPPTTWAAVTKSTFPVIIPAADPQSLYAVQQYLALGGTLRDSSDTITLNITELTKLLDYYSAARSAKVITKNTLEYETGAETWSAYRELRAPLVITNAHSYLKDAALATNTGAGPAPTHGGKPYALATVWSYALVKTDTSDESDAWKLIDWLLHPQNLGTWALKARYLPPRSDAVESWPPDAPADFAHQVLLAAHTRPEEEVLAIIGPSLGKAVRNVIRGNVTPSAAARDVIQEISSE